MAIDPYAHCNIHVPQNNCTLETCCLAQSHFLYVPSYGGNLFFTIFFAAFIIPQLGLGIWYKTWGFAVGTICGLILEVIGYVGRLQLHNNPFSPNPFLIYLICLTIAPVFISAAIYLCLTRIFVLYGKHLSRFEPRTIALTFMTSDFLSLVLQAIGGAIADTANSHHMSRIGADIMIGGLFLQAVSLAAFLLVCTDFAWSSRKGVLDMSPDKQQTRRRPILKAFMGALMLATLAILVRSIFRVAELWQGFNGSLWNNQTDFMVLDGAMIALAVLCLTALHPGPAFGGQWGAADWTFRSRKGIETNHDSTKETAGSSRSEVNY